MTANQIIKRFNKHGISVACFLGYSRCIHLFVIKTNMLIGYKTQCEWRSLHDAYRHFFMQ